MTREKFEELMSGESDYKKYGDLCRITTGAMIVIKYLPKFGIRAAEHDIVYSAEVNKIISTSITEDEVINLRELGWFIDEDTDSLAHFA